ncbi:MAG: TRAM domain-containing protein [Actinobacteria bacterium]|nr:TRAM domain-containing protein [Actinomycetota bacterium]
MIIEAVRLVVTLAFTGIGFLVGNSVPDWFPNSEMDPDLAIVLGALIGAGVGYVLGGLFGRLVRKGLDRAPDLAARATGPQLFAGAFGLLAGLIVGVVLSVPALLLLPPVAGWPLAALVVLILATAGSRVFAARSGDLLAAAGIRPARPPGASGANAPPSYLVDTSAAIDGRLLELSRAGLVQGEIWVPEFVIDELQGIADSGEKRKRRRGRRGLDVLDAMRDVPGVDLKSTGESPAGFTEVDAKLIALAAKWGATLISTDHNLTKAAALRGIKVLNPHALGESMRPSVVPGDRVEIEIEREGTEPGQGVGFLEDGTLVVVEGAASQVGETVEVEVTNAMRTSIGRMLFAKTGL